jgi:hypothetical protein
MCSGGRLLADVTVGTTERPDVPWQLEASLTPADDLRWALWAYKVAKPVGGLFRPLTGGTPYPADAIAECSRGFRHDAPDPACSCGFHAISTDVGWLGRTGFVQLEVALTGRVLAFEWPAGGVLFRAERQTVARVHSAGGASATFDRPPGTAGRLARVLGGVPTGSGPMRLALPTATPPVVNVQDDVGLCVLTPPAPVEAQVSVLS